MSKCQVLLFSYSTKKCLISQTCQFCLTICSYHVTHAFQSESTLYSVLNIKELLVGNRSIWLNVWVFVYKLSGCRFESRCSLSILCCISNKFSFASAFFDNFQNLPRISRLSSQCHSNEFSFGGLVHNIYPQI